MYVSTKRLFLMVFIVFLFVASEHRFQVYAESSSKRKIIHVYVALADNINQRIVPVPIELGNGTDVDNNLYWGARYGIKSYFRTSNDWIMLKTENNPAEDILERVIFKHKDLNAYLIADAYQGKSIKHTIRDFLIAASGDIYENVKAGNGLKLSISGQADLIVYVGHNGLMDFSLSSYPNNHNNERKDVIILACASKPYFNRAIRAAGANPLLWTTNLMAPEAYILEAALDGWVSNETAEQIRERAATAYHKYQKCGLRAARKLLVTGW